MLEGLAAIERKGSGNAAKRDLIQALNDEESGAYHLYSTLERYGQFAVRLAAFGALRARPNPGSMLEGWSLICTSAKFREAAILQEAEGISTLEELQEIVSLDLQGFFWNLFGALCGQYVCGQAPDFIGAAELLDLYEFRGDAESLDPVDRRLAFALIRFLAGGATNEALIRLGREEPFQAIVGAWEDDEEFYPALQSLINWHIDRSAAVFSGDLRYYSEPYAIFPTWIYALLRCRGDNGDGMPSAEGRVECIDNTILRCFSSPADASELAASAESEFGRRYGRYSDEPLLSRWQKLFP